VGETVPWSVSWTAEKALELKPSVDFPGFIDLIQAQRPGVGSPVFGVLNVTRHRLGMVRRLCHVCGRPTAKRDRYLFPLESGGPVTLADGEVRYGGNVPPVHLACARRAARQCPHLKGAAAQPVAFPSDEGRLIPRTDPPPGMEAFARTLPPGLKVVFSCYRLHGPAFTRLVERLRREAPPAIGPAG
jgi:ferredoxin